MTPQASGGLNIWQAVLAKLNILAFRPQRIENFEQKEMTAPDGSRQWMVKNLEMATYLRLDEKEKFLWDQVDGSKTVQELLDAFSQQFNEVSPSKLATFLENLFSNGFLTVRKVTIFSQILEKLRNRTLQSKILRLFNRRIEFKNLDPLFARLYQWFFRLFYAWQSKIVLSLVSLAGAAVFVIVSIREKIDFTKFADSYAFGVAVFLLALAILVFFHELGHALTVKHFGREVRKGGIVFCLFYPAAFYVNTDDMWMEESKRARIFVSWSGLFVNLVFGGTCSIIVLLSPQAPVKSLFYTAALISYLLFFLNINPFMPSDGYFILADALGIANLRMRSAYFIRAVLPLKLKLIWVTKTSPLKKALGLRVKSLPLSAFFLGTSFAREERIFTLFGLFSLAWSFVGMALAAGLYLLMFNIISQLWSQPKVILRFWLSLVILALAAPLAFFLYRISMALYRSGRHWIKAHHILEDVQIAFKTFFKLLLLVMAVPVLLSLLSGQNRLIHQISSYWFLVWQVLAFILVALFGWKVARGEEPFQRKIMFRILLPMAACLCLAGPGAFIYGQFGNPDLVQALVLVLAGLIIAFGFAISLIAFNLNGIEGGKLLERILMGAMVFGVPLLSGLLATHFTKSGFGFLGIFARVGPISVAMISIVLLWPTLFTFLRTELRISWMTLFSGLLMTLGWSSFWLAGADPAKFGIWLGQNTAHLASGSLLAMGVGFYYLIYAQGKFERKKRGRDAFLPLPSRMNGAFLYMFQAVVGAFANFYGRRSLASFEQEYNRTSLGGSLGVFLFEGKIKDEIPISQDLIELGTRYRGALQNLVLLMSKKTGELFCHKILAKLYDELYWDERELLTAYIFRGTDWGAHLMKSMEERGTAPQQLLAKIPLFFDFSPQEIGEICSMLKLEKYGPGQVIIQQRAEGEKMYIVRTGRLDVLRKENGSEARIDSLSDGDYFGEAALMKDEPRNATLKSLTNVELFVLEKKDFHHWVKPRLADPKQLLELLDKERFLKKAPLFSGLTPFQLSMVTSKFRLEVFPAGALIMCQGDEANKFYVISRGVVDVTQLTPDGKTNPLGERGPGESLGEIALIQGGARTATVVAKTDVRLLTLTKSDFDSMMTRYLSVRQGIELVATRRRRLDQEKLRSALQS